MSEEVPSEKTADTIIIETAKDPIPILKKILKRVVFLVLDF